MTWLAIIVLIVISIHAGWTLRARRDKLTELWILSEAKKAELAELDYKIWARENGLIRINRKVSDLSAEEAWQAVASSAEMPEQYARFKQSNPIAVP